MVRDVENYVSVAGGGVFNAGSMDTTFAQYSEDDLTYAGGNYRALGFSGKIELGWSDSESYRLYGNLSYSKTRGKNQTNLAGSEDIFDLSNNIQTLQMMFGIDGLRFSNKGTHANLRLYWGKGLNLGTGFVRRQSQIVQDHLFAEPLIVDQINPFLALGGKIYGGFFPNQGRVFVQTSANGAVAYIFNKNQRYQNNFHTDLQWQVEAGFAF